MKLEELYYQYKERLSDLDTEIIKYIVSNREKVMKMGIQQLADSVHLSKTTVMRMTKKLGFSGYSEFKYFLSNEKEELPKSNNADITELLKTDISRTLKYLDTLDMSKVNSVINESKKIYCYATGYSQGLPFKEFSKQLQNSKNIVFLPSFSEFRLAVGNLNKNDCVIVTSYTGETEEIKPIINELMLRNIHIITLSVFGDNFLSQNSDFHLYYYATPYYTPQSSVKTISFTGLTCLFDYWIRTYGVDFS